MALKKLFENTDGNTGEYWKISGLSWDVINNRTGVILSLFKDEGSRRAGKDPMKIFENTSPLYRQALNFSGDDNPVTLKSLTETGKTPVALVYEKLKNTITGNFDFTDSEDI